MPVETLMLCNVGNELNANLIPEGPAAIRAALNVIIRSQQENLRNANHHARFNASATV